MRIFTREFFLLLALLGFLFVESHAQEQKNAKQIADSYYYQESYAKAIPFYLSMAQKSKPTLDVLLKLANSYKEINKYEDADKWFSKAYALYNRQMPAEAHRQYGEILLNNKKTEEARHQFELYLSKGSSSVERSITLTNVDSIIKWAENPDKRFKVKNASYLNTPYDDWGATYNNKDGIVFTSNRAVSAKDDRSGTHFYKLYFNPFSSQQITPYSYDINQSEYHVGPVIFSKNSDTLYFTRTKVGKNELKVVKTKGKEKVKSHELELFYQIKTPSGTWTQPLPFAYNNPREYSVGHAALSSDGNTLYFVSDMNGGYGQTDIYYCKKNIDGTWESPVNCGNAINTPGKEMFPTIVNENGEDYLYFSTDGMPTLGGLDIYKVKGKRNSWGKLIHLRIPVNSPRDDYYYVTKDGINGYFSSNRQEGTGGDDIYAFYRTPLQVVSESPLKRVITLEGFVVDKETGQVIGEDIMVHLINDRTRDELICVKTSADTNRKYMFEIERGQTYTMKATARDYVPEENETFISNTSDTVLTYHKNIALSKSKSQINKIVDEINFILKNIYYDLDKYNIRPDAALELDKVAEILKQNPNITLELSSHTDCRASNAYNMRLSEKRAKSAVQYLISHGIEASRLKAKGYGETQLVNECADGVKCTESQHQENRRTEIKLFR